MDSRRRGGPSRPASSEEIGCWTHASESLKLVSTTYAKPSSVETIGRVNRFISAWPTDDIPLTEGLGAQKIIQQKLASGLGEIMAHSKQEVSVIETALEHIDVLLALRKAPEAPPSVEKRNKRPRAPSPSGTPVPVPSVLNSRSVSITLPPRTNSVGPTTNLRDAKAKKDYLMKQPLQVGRKVVFRPPKSADAEEGTWIVAVVTRVINSSKESGKYEVQDVEDQEDGQPGLTYTATSRSIVPLPDKDAPAGSPANLSQYPIFPVKSTVLALYPDTSCFYRAEVVEVPQDRATSGYMPTYKVRFDEDDGLQHSVQADWVVQFPAHLLSGPKQNGPK